jgi:hypothetical protein
MTLDKTIKKKTMNDLVFKDIAAESNLQTTESGIITEKENPILGVNKSTLLEDKQKERWIKYNKEVMELNPRYSEGIELVNGDILVRLFKKPIYTKFLQITPSIQVQLRNGAFKEVVDELAFHFIGIIVNTDKLFETKFPKGTIVQISPEQSMTKVYGEKIQYLPHGFFRDCDEDVSFSQLGYILIKQGHISSIIKDFSIEEYTKIKEYSQIKSGIIV